MKGALKGGSPAHHSSGMTIHENLGSSILLTHALIRPFSSAVEMHQHGGLEARGKLSPRQRSLGGADWHMRYYERRKKWGFSRILCIIAQAAIWDPMKCFAAQLGGEGGLCRGVAKNALKGSLKGTLKELRRVAFKRNFEGYLKGRFAEGFEGSFEESFQVELRRGL